MNEMMYFAAGEEAPVVPILGGIGAFLTPLPNLLLGFQPSSSTDSEQHIVDHLWRDSPVLQQQSSD